MKSFVVDRNRQAAGEPQAKIDQNSPDIKRAKILDNMEPFAIQCISAGSMQFIDGKIRSQVMNKALQNIK
jgi:hypothetical protein